MARSVLEISVHASPPCDRHSYPHVILLDLRGHGCNEVLKLDCDDRFLLFYSWSIWTALQAVALAIDLRRGNQKRIC